MDDETARKILDAESARLSAARLALRRERDELGTEPSMDPITDQSLVEQEIDISLLHEIEAEITAVDEARQRLEHGSYGRCEVCDQPINDDRLVAVPATRRCIDHQLVAEVRLEVRDAEAPPDGRLAAVRTDALQDLDQVPEDDDGSSASETEAERGGPEDLALHIVHP